MPNKITGYQATDQPAPVKGRGGGSPVVEKTQTAASGTTTTTATATEPAADQITFTGSARTLQRLGAAVAAAPEVDAAKVGTIKQSVQNGTYQIDAGRVADKILKFEQGLK